MKKIRWIVLGAFLGAFTLFSFAPTPTNFFEVSKNLDIFASVFREVNAYYVDDVDAGKLMKKGIDEMLNSLDPYTNFISESEAEDFRFQMTGQYGGIGAQIGQRGDYVMITDPYEGFPAQKADLRAGDLIVEIEGKSTKGKTTSDISKMLKGQPGTKVNIQIKREGETAALSKSLTREEIRVKNVPYYGMINNEIGYIRLQSFTNDAGKEVRDALTDLKRNHPLKSVVLDVRGNPGGLLHEAINIVNVFVPQGVEVVSTKGKIKEYDKSYRTLNPPVDPELPVAVLTNRSSASASEIVSGSIQDLDRGLVIGQRTFGKGLVQNTRPLSYNTQLKVTTAKYYTPSGRCIQALDYSHRNEDGSVGQIPDSLKKEFKTKRGRKVYDGGGVDPDIVIPSKKYAKITESLLQKQLIFDYATYYRTKHESIGAIRDFKFTQTDFEDFKNYIAGREYDYTTATEKALEELRKKAEEEKYLEGVKTHFDKLKLDLAHDKQADLEKNKEEIVRLLEEEILRRYYFQKSRYEYSFQTDADILEATQSLSNTERYQSLLTGKK
ncbi:MAG: S41 family peptidase [Bacteroidia bacterium]|jgi:carboxyl-terminal processing protease